MYDAYVCWSLQMNTQERSAVFKFGTGSARLDHVDMAWDVQEGAEEAPFTLSIENVAETVRDTILPGRRTAMAYCIVLVRLWQVL